MWGGSSPVSGAVLNLLPSISLSSPCGWGGASACLWRGLEPGSELQHVVAGAVRSSVDTAQGLEFWGFNSCAAPPPPPHLWPLFRLLNSQEKSFLGSSFVLGKSSHICAFPMFVIQYPELMACQLVLKPEQGRGWSKRLLVDERETCSGASDPGLHPSPARPLLCDLEQVASPLRASSFFLYCGTTRL